MQMWACLLTASLALSSAAAEAPKMTDASLRWGTYRPNVYFGVRPRIPETLLMGSMWVRTDENGFAEQYLRHSCDQNEGIAGFDWLVYDPRKGGTQIIRDVRNQIDLRTDFFKPPEEEASLDWIARISGAPRVDAPEDIEWLVVFYIGTEERQPSEESFLVCDKSGVEEAVSCYGNQQQLPNFTLHVRDVFSHEKKPMNHPASIRSDTVPPDGIWQAETIYKSHVNSGMKQTGDGTLYFIEKRFRGPFQLEVVFSSSDQTDRAMKYDLTKGLAESKSNFSQRFRKAFAPKRPFHSSLYTAFLESTLSNLLGSIGYFYGDSQVDLSQHSEYEEKDTNFWEKVPEIRSKAEPTSSGAKELLSTVPSRTFFPRGFLWDEGFNLLVVLEWDLDLALEIVQGWMALMDENGWIPREQILGSEARSRVPPEFRTQFPQHANPPTLFMVTSVFVEIISGNKTYSGHPSRYLNERQSALDLLESLYALLDRHYKWFRSTQAGDMESPHRSMCSEGYRWRGRTPNHTLPSGLDDYPRAEPPHPGELHIDAITWVAVMAKALKQISAYLGKNEDSALYLNHEIAIKKSIEILHWCEERQVFCDATIVAGNHTLVCHKGYTSLAPFFLGLLETEDPHVGPLLDLIQNETELWSPSGVRSLSKQNEHYGVDENYWRGAVWMNINFLILQQLLVLAQGQGTYRDQARKTYIALRKNLVTTVYNSWRRTGFVWEHYNADTGLGGGAFQFTGWTSLIVKIATMPDLRTKGLHTMTESTQNWTYRSHLMFYIAILAAFAFVFRRRIGNIYASLIIG